MQSSARSLLGIGLFVACLSPFLAALRSGSSGPAYVTDPINEIWGEAMLVYKPAAVTGVQGVWPLALQRGVQLDGMLRSAPHPFMVIAGNPYENVWRAPAIGGVRLDTGAFAEQDVDIALPAEGFSWVIGRSYNAVQYEEDTPGHLDSNGYQGRNWFQTSQPEIHFYDDATDTKDMVYLVYGADRYVEYKRVVSGGVTFKGANGAAGIFEFTDGGAGADTYKLTDQHGNELTFFGFDGDAGAAAGQLWTIEDPAGNKAYVGDASSASTAISNGYDGSGRILYAYDTSDRRYTYTYSTLDSVDRLTEVKAETKTGGTWSGTPTGVATVMEVDYAYYTSETYGDPGDLKTVTITTPLTDSGVSDVRTKYYRYWEGTYDSSTNPGYAHAIQYVVDYEGVRRFDWSDQLFDGDYLTATENSLKPYAAAYFEYDSSHRVRTAWFNGECGCSGANNGTYQFEYESNGSYSDTANTYDQTWCTRTVVQRPDTSYMTQYFDEAGQPLSQVITDADPDNTSPVPDRWVTKVTRAATAFITEVATPANCTGYTHSTGAITSSTSAGLVWVYSRPASGSTKGYVTSKKFKEGSAGTEYYDTQWEFTQSDKVLQSGMTGEKAVVRPTYAKVHHYQVQSTSTADQITTTITKADHSGTIAHLSNKADEPAIATGENGSGTAVSATPYYRLDGTSWFNKAGDGILTYEEYTDGQRTKVIEDADTGETGDFDAIPSGLSSSGTPIHRTTTYAYDAQGRLDMVTEPDGRKIKHYYSKLADRRLVHLVYNDYETTPKFYGPVQYTVTNHAGQTEATATVALTSNESTTALTGHVDETDDDPITAMDLGTLARLSTSVYDTSGAQMTESRLYFDIPSSGDGSDGTNYDGTFYGYDDSGRRWRKKAPHGTISRTVYDSIGRVASHWTGTNDSSFSGGESSGTDNMVKTDELEYDGGADDGNGYVTERTRFVQDSTTDQRVTSYAYDARGRLLLQTNPTAPHAFHAYDNEGRRTATGLFSSTASITVGTDDPTTETTNRLALTRQYYDDNGRLWKSTRHNIDAADGSDDDNLEHLRWYDAAGRILKEDGPELVKYVYDRLGRRTRRQVIADDNDTVYANVDDVTGDYLVEESITAYDTDTDEVWMQVRIDRKHNDWTVSPTTGNLDTNSDGDDLLLTNTDVKGRAQITCFWYDRFGRRTDQVLYGTYNAATFDRDPIGGLSVPSRSDTELVTSYTYGIDGAVSDVTDQRGLVMHTDYDDAGRKTAEIRNYNASVNLGLPANPDDNQTVRYEYTDGLRTKLTADMPSGETDQVTLYIYGTTKGTPSAMKIASGHLLRAVKYPDTTNSGTTLSAIDTDSSDVVSYAYNAQGQVISQKDQAGNVFDVEFDDSGRETSRAVTTLATGFDGAVRVQAHTYDSLGRPSLVTQYDATTSGSVTDEAGYTYDGWGGVTSFKQDKDSAVGGSGYYEVAYAYAKATGGRNTVRRSSMTLPGSRTITIDYSRYKDDELSRVSKLMDGTTSLARYTYMGDSRVVGTEYPEPDISSLAFDSTSGSHSGYLDRHNRILQSRWSTDAPNPSIDFYQVDLEYDRNSNITWAEDNVHEGHDVMYTMDDLDRLIDAEEGTRSGSSITSRTRHQTWLHSSASQLSHTGNWTRSKLDINGDDDWIDTEEYDDSRTHNAVNELTARDVDSDATDDYTLSYDAAGDLTDDGEDYKYEYDAFCRLCKVRDQSDTLVAEYRYNGLGYMIGVHEDTDDDGDADGSDVWFYPVYDEAWREVARYRESDSDPKQQFVNACAGPDGYGRASYINDVVCRDRDANSGWTSASDGTLEERYYYCPNWRGDVSVLVTSGGDLHERPKYSPYGIPNASPGADCDSDGDCDAADASIAQGWIDASHYDVRADIDLDGDVDSTDKSNAASAVFGIALGWEALGARGNVFGFGGYVKLQASYKLQVRMRALTANLGRWQMRDPAAYQEDRNLYTYCSSSPQSFLDPSGALSRPPVCEGCTALGPTSDPDTRMGPCAPIIGLVELVITNGTCKDMLPCGDTEKKCKWVITVHYTSPPQCASWHPTPLPIPELPGEPQDTPGGGFLPAALPGLKPDEGSSGHGFRFARFTVKSNCGVNIDQVTLTIVATGRLSATGQGGVHGTTPGGTGSGTTKIVFTELDCLVCVR